MHVHMRTRASLGRRAGNDENTIGANLDALNQKPLWPTTCRCQPPAWQRSPLRTLVSLRRNCTKSEPEPILDTGSPL